MFQPNGLAHSPPGGTLPCGWYPACPSVSEEIKWSLVGQREVFSHTRLFHADLKHSSRPLQRPHSSRVVLAGARRLGGRSGRAHRRACADQRAAGRGRSWGRGGMEAGPWLGLRGPQQKANPSPLVAGSPTPPGRWLPATYPFPSCPWVSAVRPPVGGWGSVFLWPPPL